MYYLPEDLERPQTLSRDALVETIGSVGSVLPDSGRTIELAHSDVETHLRDDNYSTHTYRAYAAIRDLQLGLGKLLDDGGEITPELEVQHVATRLITSYVAFHTAPLISVEQGYITAIEDKFFNNATKTALMEAQDFRGHSAMRYILFGI